MRKEAVVILIMIGIVLCLIVIVGGGIFVKNLTKDISQESKTIKLGSKIDYTVKSKNDMPYCGDEMVFFKRTPFGMKDCSHVVPLGAVDPPIKVFPSERLDFFISSKINNSDFSRRVNIVSPGHAWITRITKITGPSGTKYSIYLNPCQELTFVIDNVVFLDENILSKMESFSDCEGIVSDGYGYEYCSQEIFVEVDESEIIGRAGGTAGESSIGLSAYDKRINEIDLINEYRFDFNEYGIPSCPLYYFVFDSRTSVEEKIGTIINGTFYRRVQFPFCGEIYQDLPNTLQGFWFLKNVKNSKPEDPHIALIHDNINPSLAIFSIGNSFEEIDAGKYVFEPEPKPHINQDFQTTRQGITYCYKLSDINNRFFTVLIELIDENNMKMEARKTNTCSGNNEFSENALFFMR